MPDFSLLQAPNFAQAALSGYQAGRQIHQQNERQGALEHYLQNPSDPVGLTRLAAADPELGFPLMKQQRDEAQRKQIGDLAQRAAGGDHQAALQLYQLDPDLANRFDAQHNKTLDEGKAALGNAALHVALLPEDQRPAAWARAVDGLSGQFPDLRHYRDEYSPQNLDGVLDFTGVRPKLIELQQPHYVVGPQTEQMMQTNPLAGPLGAQGASSSAGLAPGAIVNGHRFKGGDRRDPNNWEAVGGASPSGSHDFR